MPENDKPPEDREKEVEDRALQEVIRDRRIEQLREDIERRQRRLTLNASLIVVMLGGALAAAAYVYRKALFLEENIVLISFGVTGLLYLGTRIFTSGQTDTTRLQADLDTLLLEKEVSDRLKARTGGLLPEAVLPKWK